jgi:hypothetical protein
MSSRKWLVQYFLSKIKLKSSEVERNRKVLKNDKKLEIKVQDKKCNKQKE